MTIYYTYYSYEEFGRGYIGYRKCPEHLTPETDLYLGSYTDKKFKPTQKIILGTYNNRTEAIADEITLHKAYDVAANSHFANRARMTSVGFSTAGIPLPHSAEHRAKIGAANKGRTISAETRAKLSEAQRGKQLSAETRAKMSKNNAMKRPEVAAKVSETQRKKAKRFNWVNTKTGEKHDNLCISELQDLYPELHKSVLGVVSLGKRKHHKGWTIQP